MALCMCGGGGVECDARLLVKSGELTILYGRAGERKSRAVMQRVNEAIYICSSESKGARSRDTHTAA